jgi:drug/metabolite transporter, DME family
MREDACDPVGSASHRSLKMDRRDADPTGLTEGRLCIAAAAVLWSLSGAFTKILTSVMVEDYDFPPVSPVQIAFYRTLFAGVVLAPMLRRADVAFHRLMLPMALCFAAMNALFVTALAEGTSANAILLQYTAPMWMYLASIFLLGERADRRATMALAGGLLGIAVIVMGGGEGAQISTVVIALSSGVAYAGVMLFLRVLRALSPTWLTVWNHWLGSAVLLPWIWGLPLPTWQQFIVLGLFGSVQMGLAYWLVARGLRTVSPQEAGAITLLEPLLNPVWAYLVWPKTETPGPATYIGGALILGALAWRYWPRKA